MCEFRWSLIHVNEVGTLKCRWPDTPDGLLQRTIWEVVLGNSLEKGRHLREILGDWTNHLSIRVCPGLTSDWSDRHQETPQELVGKSNWNLQCRSLLWCCSGYANLWRSRHCRFPRWSSHLSHAHSVKGYWLVQTLLFSHKHKARSLLRWIHDLLITWFVFYTFQQVSSPRRRSRTRRLQPSVIYWRGGRTTSPKLSSWQQNYLDV